MYADYNGSYSLLHSQETQINHKTMNANVFSVILFICVFIFLKLVYDGNEKGLL